MNSPYTFILVVVGWIFSLCLHEWAHARMAYEGGDDSVVEKGYLTFNPLKYMDPIFSIVLPLVFLVMGGIGLPGGAVYIDQSRLKSKAWSTWVSLAGPAANMALAIVIGLIFRFAPPPADGGGPALAFIGVLQVTAVFFNLIPMPPLDGYGAYRAYLNLQTQHALDSFGMMGMILLFVVFNNIEVVNTVFWTQVAVVSHVLGIDLSLVRAGQEQFFFWR